MQSHSTHSHSSIVSTLPAPSTFGASGIRSRPPNSSHEMTPAPAFANAAPLGCLVAPVGSSSTCRRSAPVPTSYRVSMMADDKPKNPLAGLGGLGNIMDAMKKAQEFTTVAKDLQEQLRSTVIEASVRSGQVTVTMTGQQVPLKVVVTDDLLAKGSEEVSAAVTEGVIAAHAKSSEYMKEKMGNLTKGLGMPNPPGQ